MTNFEGAYFVILGIMAFAFLFYEGKFSLNFKVVSALLFFTLALVLFAQYTVAFTSFSTDGTNTWHDTKNLIVNDATETILAYLFLVMGIISGMMFFIDALLKAKGANV